MCLPPSPSALYFCTLLPPFYSSSDSQSLLHLLPPYLTPSSSPYTFNTFTHLARCPTYPSPPPTPNPLPTPHIPLTLSYPHALPSLFPKMGILPVSALLKCYLVIITKEPFFLLYIEVSPKSLPVFKTYSMISLLEILYFFRPKRPIVKAISLKRLISGKIHYLFLYNTGLIQPNLLSSNYFCKFLSKKI